MSSSRMPDFFSACCVAGIGAVRVPDRVVRTHRQVHDAGARLPGRIAWTAASEATRTADRRVGGYGHRGGDLRVGRVHGLQRSPSPGCFRGGSRPSRLAVGARFTIEPAADRGQCAVVGRCCKTSIASRLRSPMIGDALGGVELVDRASPKRATPALALRERCGPAARPASPTRWNARHRLHAATASTTSCVPLMTAWAAKCRPARTAALAVDRRARTFIGVPAASHAVRAMSPASAPMVSTQPNTTSSYSAGGMSLRSTMALMTCAPGRRRAPEPVIPCACPLANTARRR